MPRPINFALLDLYDYNDMNKIMCYLQDCKGKVLFRHAGNLQRHLKSLHPEIYISYLENRTVLQSECGFYMQKKLIDLVRDKPILWDQSIMNENNQKLYIDTWEEISQKLNLNVEICKQKWKNLKDYFRKETINEPKPTITDPRSSWKLFSKLLFLRDEVLTRENSKNIKQTEEIDSILNSIKEESNESDVSEMDLDFKTEENESLENIINNSYDNHHCQKRTAITADNSDEQPKAKMIKTEFENENEEEKMFLLSLLPYLKTIPEDRRLIVRQRIQGVLLEDKAHCSVLIESNSRT